MKKQFTYRDVVIMLTLVMAGAAVLAYAGVTVPNSFTSGATAKSADVNANFTYLADRSWEKSGGNLYYSSGNIGVGTTSPITPFSVEVPSDNTGTRYQMALHETGVTNSWLIAAGNNFVINYDPISSQIRPTAVYPFFIQGNTKNIGLSNNNPQYPLHMGSGAYVTTGGVWTNASSREYKDNITELSSEKAMSAFKGLKPVTYNYKTDKSEKHVGFIAEDVPAIVATKDRKGISSMDVTALLTKVVQEQQKTIASLSIKVAELEAKVK